MEEASFLPPPARPYTVHPLLHTTAKKGALWLLGEVAVYCVMHYSYWRQSISERRGGN